MPKKMTLGQHFEWLHNNPPPPFNPDYDPKAEARFHQVTQSLVDEGFYKAHTREECKLEWRRRYDQLLQC